MPRGKFITLEGGEGAGKSTQTQSLVAFLKTKGIDAIATREVGGAPGAEDIRALWLGKGEGFWDPLTEVMLIMAARREHLARTIEPALEKGLWVVSDRYVDSTRAYQGLAMGLGVPLIDRIYACLAGSFWPDATYFLDVPVTQGFARVGHRAGPDDRYEQKGSAFHEKLRQAFHDLATQEADRFTVIDATGDAAAVAQKLQADIARRFGVEGAT